MKLNIIFVILLIALFFFTCWCIKTIYKKTNKYYRKRFKIDEIYLINLQRRPDRLENFMTHFNKSDFKGYNVMKFDSVDGTNLKIDSVPLSEVARAELKQIETTGFRSKHYQLTRGAIGCYLSHVKVWEHMLKQTHDRILIFEDDAQVPPNLLRDIDKSMKHIPTNWDIVLFGYHCKVCTNEKKYKKVDRFILLHCYMIKRNAIIKLLKTNTLFPITQQIDSLLSELSNILNIYAVDKHLIKQFGSRTDIQLPLLDNKSKHANDRMPTTEQKN